MVSFSNRQHVTSVREHSCSFIVVADEVSVGCVERSATHQRSDYNPGMGRYRRNRIGKTFFFTTVTDGRQPILTTDLGRCVLRHSISAVRHDLPFRIVAIVLLPDHLHAIWEMPSSDTDYSKRWRLIKTEFTKQWRKLGGATMPRSSSRLTRGERGVWQRRFFEHTCRDEADLKRCIDISTLIRSSMAWCIVFAIGPGRRSTDSSPKESIRSIGEMRMIGTAMSSISLSD